MALFKLLAGKHSEGRKSEQRVFVKGDYIESKKDLVKLFGPEHFERAEKGSGKATKGQALAGTSTEILEDEEDETQEVDGSRLKKTSMKKLERAKANWGDGDVVHQEDVPEAESEEVQSKVAEDTEASNEEREVRKARSEKVNGAGSEEDDKEVEKDEEDNEMGDDVTDEFDDSDKPKNRVFKKGTKYVITSGKANKVVKEGLKRSQVNEFFKSSSEE